MSHPVLDIIARAPSSYRYHWVAVVVKIEEALRYTTLICRELSAFKTIDSLCAQGMQPHTYTSN